jgi:phage baseplate assembly protein V
VAENTGGASFKIGLVAEAKPGFARVRFPDLDDLVSDWLPVAHGATLGNRQVSTLDVNSQVGCLLDDHFETGMVVGAIYSDVDAPPTTSGDETAYHFGQADKMVYDREAQVLTISVGGCTVTVDGDGITVTGGDVKADGKSLKLHFHNNTQPGSGNTGLPQ